jgi:hypothetical protein
LNFWQFNSDVVFTLQVKVGLMGVVGRYDAIDFYRYPRDTHVIVRSDRGLESGIVICDIEADDPSLSTICGQVLRQTSAEDRLILERLDRYRDKAFEACERLLIKRGLPDVLVDVEHSFDGKSVFFYFLGDIGEELGTIMMELGEVYERKVRFRKFSETLANGCGPTCGTKEGACSTTSCGSCSLAGGCSKK